MYHVNFGSIENRRNKNLIMINILHSYFFL